MDAKYLQEIKEIDRKLDALYAYCGDSIDEEIGFDLYKLCDDIMKMLKGEYENGR